MANTLIEARRELALANRIVAHEGIIDAFGHVSMRHPDNPGRYLLSRSRAPELVTPEDFIEYDLDSQPVRDPGVGQYSERVIHGEIYKARPEVMSVCHHHCPAFMPLLATGTDYVPVFHLGAVGGIKPPFWDQHDEFGDTNMLVVKPEEGRLARARARPALDGADEAARRHRRRHQRARLRVPFGLSRRAMPSTRCNRWRSAAPSPRCRRARPNWPARSVANTTGLTRSWEYWSMRVAKAGGVRDAVGAAKKPAKGAAQAKPRRSARPKPGAADEFGLPQWAGLGVECRPPGENSNEQKKYEGGTA